MRKSIICFSQMARVMEVMSKGVSFRHLQRPLHADWKESERRRNEVVKEAKLGTGDTPKQCNIRIDKSHWNAGLADELVPGGADGVLSLSAPQRSGTTMRIGKPLACHISPSNRGKPLKLLGSQHSLSKWSSELPGSSTVMFDRCSKR